MESKSFFPKLRLFLATLAENDPEGYAREIVHLL